MIQTLDVIVIPDETIKPPGPKLIACIHPANGWYYRINTKGHWRPSIRLVKTPLHEFLSWDSYLECGDPLELDDYVIEQAIERGGVIGQISPTLCAAISLALNVAHYLKDSDKIEIRDALSNVK